MRQLASSLATVTAATGWPAWASACAVCFSARDESRLAFFGTTALLTLLPLVMIGATVLWLRLRSGRD